MTSDIAIINNFDPKPAMYTRVPTPKTWKTKYEHDKYWDIEKKRWVEGYSGLTGPHYLMLQELMIPDAFGMPIRPHWRDCDSLIFEAIRECRKPDVNHDLFVMKRREIGLSTIGGGVLPLHTALLNPGSTSLMTSADKDRLGTLFTEKLKNMHEWLHPSIRPEKLRTREGMSITFGKEDKKLKTTSGLLSKIIGKETVKTPTSMEAYRALYGFLDELFLHPKASKVRASAARCFMKGTDKVGFMLMGGTCGESIHKGVEEGKKIYKDSLKRKIMTLFLRGTLGLDRFSVNGWSDEVAAERWIMEEREMLSHAEDKTDYFKFVTDYPLSEEEILGLVTDSILPPEILFMLDRAEKAIAAEQIREQRYSLERVNARVQAIPDKKGKFVIIHPPAPGHQYGAGTDPIPFGNASLGDGSDYALLIKDRTIQRHVAYYAERNLDSEVVLHNSLLLQDLYGVNTMLELNRGEVIYKEYINAGRTEMLAMMPTHLGIVFEKRKYPHGVFKNNHIEDRMNKFWWAWLLKHAGNMRMKRLIEECKNWTKKNTDILDAALLEIIDEADLLQRAKTMTSTVTTHQVVEFYRGPDGKTHRRTKDVRVASAPPLALIQKKT